MSATRVDGPGRDDAASEPHPRRVEPRWRSRPLADDLAPLVVWGYVILLFDPFLELLHLPGFVSSVVMPAFGLGVLLVTPSDRIRRLPISMALVALLGWLTASYAWSIVPDMTFYNLRSQFGPLVVLILVVGTMRPEVAIQTFLRAFLVVLGWSFFWSIVSGSGRATMAGEEVQFGFRGTFGHKNELGVFAVYGLCMVLAFVRGPRRRWAIALCVLTVFGTRSATAASGLLAVAFGWTFVAALQRQRSSRERQFLVVVGVGAVIFAVLMVLGLLPALLDLYDKDTTFSGRTDIWATSIESIADEPIQGYGFGAAWADGWNPVTRRMHLDIGFGAAHSHNSVLEMLLEAGVVGLALSLAVYVQTARSAVAAFARPATTPYGQWAALTLVSMIVMGIAEPLLRGVHLGLVGTAWVVLFHVLREERRTSAPRDRVSL